MSSANENRQTCVSFADFVKGSRVAVSLEHRLRVGILDSLWSNLQARTSSIAQR